MVFLTQDLTILVQLVVGVSMLVVAVPCGGGVAPRRLKTFPSQSPQVPLRAFPLFSRFTVELHHVGYVPPGLCVALSRARTGTTHPCDFTLICNLVVTVGHP